MKFEFSLGGVVFRKVKKHESISVKILFLITKSSPSDLYPHTYWRLPKGWIDDENDKPGPFARGDMKTDEKTLHKAALREVREEAGVEVKIIKKICANKLFFIREGEKFIKFITFYLMEWVKDLPEGFGFETNEIGWFSLEKAKEKLKYKSEKAVLEKASEILGSGTQENLL